MAKQLFILAVIIYAVNAVHSAYPNSYSDNNQPSYGGRQQSYNNYRKSAPVAAPSYNDDSNDNVDDYALAPAPVYQPPTYHDPAPAPVYHAPAPVYRAPVQQAPSYNEPESYQSPTPSYKSAKRVGY